MRMIVPIGAAIRGDALTHQGETVEGIAQTRQGIAELRAMGTLVMPIAFAGLAEALARSGKAGYG